MNSQQIIDCQAGNQDSFLQLHNVFYDQLLRLCSKYHPNEAEDILQEVFIIIFQKIKSYNHNGSFEGWLKRITINTSLNYVRKKRYTENIDSVPNIGYEHQKEWGIILQDYQNLIKQLPEQKQLIFEMYEIEGYKHKEIAKLLGITSGSSRDQLSKAKKILIQKHKQEL